MRPDMNGPGRGFDRGPGGPGGGPGGGFDRRPPQHMQQPPRMDDRRTQPDFRQGMNNQQPPLPPRRRRVTSLFAIFMLIVLGALAVYLWTQGHTKWCVVSGAAALICFFGGIATSNADGYRGFGVGSIFASIQSAIFKAFLCAVFLILFLFLLWKM